MKNITLLLIAITSSFLHPKAYKLTNLTKYKTIKVQVRFEGVNCGKQIKTYDIKQKESEEIIATRHCSISNIHLLPVNDIATEEILMVKANIDDKVETIAIKHAADGYKLTYY